MPQHHHATLHPFHNKKAPALRGQCIALLEWRSHARPQCAVYIIIYLKYFISSPSPARASSSAVPPVSSGMPVRIPSAAAAVRSDWYLEHVIQTRTCDRERYQYHTKEKRPNQIPVVPEFLREDHRSVSLAVESVEKSAAAQRAERHRASQQCASSERACRERAVSDRSGMR